VVHCIQDSSETYVGLDGYVAPLLFDVGDNVDTSVFHDGLIYCDAIREGFQWDVPMSCYSGPMHPQTKQLVSYIPRQQTLVVILHCSQTN